MKVLQVIGALGIGGAETWLMELLRYWHRQGSSAPQVEFLATGGEPDHFDDEARALGARIHYLPFRRGGAATFIRGWRALLRRGGYDVLHDHQEYASGWHYLAGAGCLPPVRITHVHNPILGYRSNYGVTAARRLLATAGWRLVDRFATHVCGTSAQVLREYGYAPGRAGRRQISVLHCGFDIATFCGARDADRASVLREFGWPADAKLVLSVGRIDRAVQFRHPQNHKNSWFALNVVRQAAQQDKALCYLVAGDGGARAELERRVAQWGLSARLRFLGNRGDVPRLLRAADALLFPSAKEGLGMAAVEAQAAGLPVLASTAVPAECVVLPEFYRSLSLDEPLEQWAKALLQSLSQPRASPERCTRTFAHSGFVIERSARSLMNIYSSGPA